MTRKTKSFWQIEMTAKNVLEHHGCYNRPYEGIDFIIESCKIELIPVTVDDDKFMGFLGDDGKGHRFITFNQSMIDGRILFTKAHELGHFMLDHELKTDILVDGEIEQKDPQETEANVFASALLMPKQLVIAVVKKSLANAKIKTPLDSSFDYDGLDASVKQQIVADMQSVFHASKICIGWRLKNVLECYKV